MADIRNDFVGIKSPNPFWLASAPPTDKEYNVVRAFKAGWGGVVWKTLGEAGAAHRQRQRPQLRRGLRCGPATAGAEQYRTDHRPPSGGEPPRNQAGQARLAGPRHGRLPDGALRGGGLEGDPAACRGHGRRRDRAQFRLPARHERTRHGLGGGSGSRIYRDGHPLVQTAHPHAGHREADAEHHRYPLSGPGGAQGRGGCGEPDQHGAVCDLGEPGHVRAGTDH